MKFLDENRTSELWQAVKNKVNSLVLSITTAQQTANTATEAATAAQNSADNAQSTANAAKTTAEAALPKSGGVMTGPITGITTPTVDTGAANKLYVDSSIVRTNLADNAYFRNVINQRGQTEYNTSGYTIDRWKFYKTSDSTEKITVESDGILINGANGFSQIPDPSIVKYMRGKTVTFSALVTCITPSATAFGIAGDDWVTGFISLQNTPGTFLVSGSSFISDITTDNYKFLMYIATTGVYKVHAIKYEIGSYQTLARQENGKWVLNEIPDYATELLKCQMYFQIHQPNAYLTPISLNNTSASLLYQFPTMRAVPAITLTGATGITTRLPTYDSVLIEGQQGEYVSSIQLTAEL